ncbi:MAG: hypothetical protein Q7U53_04805 [Anaerolineaceae bacterium]|nr:hypothetical protein [Anaerolineaceae bacterium]
MKYKKFVLIIFFLSIIASGCKGNNEPVDSDTPAVSETFILPTAQINNSDKSFLAPCNLISLAEMETIFQESPLFITEENGGCVVRNQWDTRSIWFSIFQGEQALPAMQWHTKNLIAGWTEQRFNTLVEEILSNESNQSLEALQESRLVLYEELEYRWERYFTFGDFAYWILNPRAFLGVFDVIEGDMYFQIGYSGFLAAQIQSPIEDLSKKILERLPDQFFVDFDFPEETNEEATTNDELQSNIPEIIDITRSSQEIYFGDLCAGETTTIRVQIGNYDAIDNVYLVYRLLSSEESNDNWQTIFMNQLTPDTWEIVISAESSFLTYQLVNASQVEYSVAIIYGVNNVLRSTSFRDITVLQCRQ